MQHDKMKPHVCPIVAHVLQTTESCGLKLKDNGYAHAVAAAASMRELEFDRHMIRLLKNSILERKSRWSR